MSKMFLPFYDIGSSVGPNQPNNPLDIALCDFLFGKVKARMRGPTSHPMISWSGANSGPWIELLANLLRKMGYSISLPSGNIINPASQNASSLIVALNALYYKINPTEYLKPSFTFQTSGAVVVGTLTGHMLNPQSIRSPWFGMFPKNDGPQRELPFYDLKTSIQYNPSTNVPQTVGPLCSYLLRLICNGNSPAKPSQITSQISYQSEINLATLPLFAEKFAQLGWFCSDKNNIHPSYGNVNSNSMIIPINYFAYKVSEAVMFGMVSHSYLCLYDMPFFPQSLKTSLLADCESSYFKC